MEAGGVDGLAGGKVVGELGETFAQLAAGSDGVGAFGVIQADGDVNKRLKEAAAGSTLRSPNFLPDFVALEKSAGVEEANAALDEFFHGMTPI